MDCAEIALDVGDLGEAARKPLEEAMRTFRRFPNLGAPGAERVLLFCGAHPVLSLDSNGLRVLVRLGFAPQLRSYAATYRAVREAVDPQTPEDVPWIIRAHQLLRRHGQLVCRRTMPECGRCVLRKSCAFAARYPRAGDAGKPRS